jgi:hypothetical protein
MDFIEGIKTVGNSVGINNISSYFLVFFYFIFYYNSLGIYRENIFIDKIYCNLSTKIFL